MGQPMPVRVRPTAPLDLKDSRFEIRDEVRDGGLGTRASRFETRIPYPVSPVLLGHRIEPSSCPRVAPKKAAGGEPATAGKSVASQCLARVDRAGRLEPAAHQASPRKKRRGRGPIDVDRRDRNPGADLIAYRSGRVADKETQSRHEQDRRQRAHPPPIVSSRVPHGRGRTRRRYPAWREMPGTKRRSPWSAFTIARIVTRE